MPRITWDWRPGLFEPPFFVKSARDVYDVVATGAAPQSWIVARLWDGSAEDAENLRRLIELRYDTETSTQQENQS